MPCSYRLYVRPDRVGSPPTGPVVVKHAQAGAPAPAAVAESPRVVDTPPHVALVRQYAW